MSQSLFYLIVQRTFIFILVISATVFFTVDGDNGKIASTVVSVVSFIFILFVETLKRRDKKEMSD